MDFFKISDFFTESFCVLSLCVYYGGVVNRCAVGLLVLVFVGADAFIYEDLRGILAALVDTERDRRGCYGVGFEGLARVGRAGGALLKAGTC